MLDQVAIFVCLLCRDREKEKMRADRSVQSTPTLLSKQQETEQLHREQQVQLKIHMRSLKVGVCTAPNLTSLLIHINAFVLVF